MGGGLSFRNKFALSLFVRVYYVSYVRLAASYTKIWGFLSLCKLRMPGGWGAKGGGGLVIPIYYYWKIKKLKIKNPLCNYDSFAMYVYVHMCRR